MEMPKEGRLTLQISADGAVYVVNRCNITAETYTTEAVPVPPHGRLIDADAPIPLVDTHGKNIEVTVAHIIENNLGIVNAIIESEASR